MQADKRKARLVSQGFNQAEIHFNETFAAAARLNSIRLLMYIAARFDMKLHQFDETCTYLNDILDFRGTNVYGNSNTVTRGIGISYARQ